MPHTNPHLAIIGDRQALGWVLQEQRLAFPEPRYHHIFPALEAGDQLYLYTTRGCYRNPGRDRGLVIGTATVTGELERPLNPRVVRDRELPIEVPVRIEALAPLGDGVNVADTVGRMTSFPKPESWSVYLRRSLYLLTGHDAALLDRKLRKFAGQHDKNIYAYLERARPVVYADQSRS